MENSQEPLFIGTGADVPRPELPFVERQAITAAVRNPQTGEYLGLRWKKVDWETLITGGIEVGQTAEQAARAEVREETGYKNLRLVAKLPGFSSKFYHHVKGENRFAHFQCFLFELENGDRDIISEKEQGIHEAVWIKKEDLGRFRLPEGHRFLIDYILEKGL